MRFDRFFVRDFVQLQRCSTGEVACLNPHRPNRYTDMENVSEEGGRGRGGLAFQYAHVSAVRLCIYVYVYLCIYVYMYICISAQGPGEGMHMFLQLVYSRRLLLHGNRCGRYCRDCGVQSAL